jgi:hypothetical protein
MSNIDTFLQAELSQDTDSEEETFVNTFLARLARRSDALAIKVSALQNYLGTDPGGGDTTAPTISNVVSTPGSSSCVISFSTSEPCTARIGWGVGANPTINTAITTSAGLSHSYTIPSLAAATAYKWRAEATDIALNITTDTSDRTFTTTAAPATTIASRTGWNSGFPSNNGWNDGTNMENFEDDIGNEDMGWTGAWGLQAQSFTTAQFGTYVSSSGGALEGCIGDGRFAKFASNAWKVMFTAGFIPSDGSAATGNTGAYDGHIEDFFDLVVATGHTGDFWLRINHEFSGNGWYSWFCGTTSGAQQTWRTYTQRVITMGRAILAPEGITLKIFQCSATDLGVEWFTNAYLGDSYVDYIGTDDYDNNAWTGKASPTNNAYSPWSNPAAAWAVHYSNANHIEDVLAFADSRGKPFALGECGPWAHILDPAVGGGDNGYYIDRIFELQTANDDMVVIFFTDDLRPNWDHDVFSGRFPNMAARMVANY